ncbi:hypothetical protein [Fodinibius sp. Rm-B-1B1-1]|uniref:hypothetical protein n=1 Tax=Fodinibius alkaliphilus TaxID=3140241 RepID=UPI00315A94D3
MEQDSNPNDEDSDTSLQSKLERTLQKKVGNGVSIVDINATKADSQSTADIAEVQEMVCKKMHKAMSPISAISGYLELMKMLLEQDTNSESLERYRSKVEEGIGEVGDIIEDLHSVFDDMRREDNDSVVQSDGMPSNKSRKAS